MALLRKNINANFEVAVSISEIEYQELLDLYSSPFPEDKIRYNILFEKYNDRLGEQAENFFKNINGEAIRFENIEYSLDEEFQGQNNKAAKIFLLSN